ncbi:MULTISPECIES: hypothetical protein [Pseudomonas]|uniref:hypothetical protein n=1 Tax=Pseudomonas TaxID=286 RepID=UPI001140107A|nr:MULTISPECIES: hypothetical protein [Pseudomonas]MDR9865790.1 hypothetical protein [Pseudomonas baetica]
MYVVAVGFCRGRRHSTGSAALAVMDMQASIRNNNKGGQAMFKQPKVRQAGLILFATTLLLILPNLTKVIG